MSLAKPMMVNTEKTAARKIAIDDLGVLSQGLSGLGETKIIFSLVKGAVDD